MSTDKLAPEIEISYCTEVQRDPTATAKIRYEGYEFRLQMAKNTLSKGRLAWAYDYGVQPHVKMEDAIAEMQALLIKNWNPKGLRKVSGLDFTKQEEGCWRAKASLPGYEEFSVLRKNKLDHATGLKTSIYEVFAHKSGKPRGESIAVSAVSSDKAMHFANEFYASRVRIYNGRHFFSNINDHERRI